MSLGAQRPSLPPCPACRPNALGRVGWGRAGVLRTRTCQRFSSSVADVEKDGWTVWRFSTLLLAS